MKTEETKQAEESGLVGFEASDPQISFEGGEATLTGDVKHIGKIGSFTIKYDGKLNAKPLLIKAVDLIEKAIPGDQSVWANLAKSAINGL